MSVRVKGLSMVAFERTLTELKGDGAIERLFPGVPPEVAHALRHKEILTVGWYPMEWFASLHTAAQLTYGPEISREIGRTATRHDVTTLYRFILKFLSPETMVKQLGRIFTLFCETGTVHIEENRKGFARVKYGGCEGSSRGVWEDILGSTEVLIELCGGKSPSARIISGGGSGEGTMVCELSWTDR
ncbi:MAG: hypothetical protein HOW73_15095 [Polyangiaceae bacterium]|nr:hypothetical protein [Polyangiaceae bacterium]